MYKTIVVQVDDHPRMEARLRAAAWLANAYDAHLVGSAATGLSRPAYALLSGSMAAAPGGEYGALRAGGRASLARFAERARRLGVQSLEERLVEDESRDALLLQARYADLVVTGQDDGAPTTARGLPEYLALRFARPVLMVPPSYAGAPLDDAILAGWDGSVPALRAIDGALPLLRRARAVRLVLVNPEREGGLHGGEPGADMALYLARHGVPVEVLVERTAAAPGEALLGLARAGAAGLLVSGAFGRSRYRELVLGGVTRSLVRHAAARRKRAGTSRADAPA